MTALFILFVLICVIMGAVFYFVPTIVAFSNGHKNKAAIFALNFFLGWTLIGWVGSLVWSLTRE
jgi:hypothetical protein